MLATIWNILRESAVFILVGFVIAGLIQSFLTGERLLRPLRSRHPRSVFLATLIGAPLPLCSCSVLPTAISLRRKGASSGAVVSFLVSTPETGVTSIFLTYALLGPLMAVYRPIAACVSAITAGFAALAVERRGESGAPSPAPTDPQGPGSDVPAQPLRRGLESQRTPMRWWSRFVPGLRYAFVDIFDDIAGWLLVGVVVAAAIHVWLPPDVMAAIAGDRVRAMILMVLIGIPLYVCAEASTPIAAALIAQGVSPGAALVFLLCGPATNIGSLGVLRRELGRRLLVPYLAAIIVVAVVMGIALDVILGATGMQLDARALDEPFVPTPLKTLGAVVFLGLTLVTARRRRWLGKVATRLDRVLPGGATPRKAAIILAVVAVIAWLLSGCFIVRPGEEGVVRRFGGVVRSGLGPGLHVALPYPVDRPDKIAVSDVRRLLIGYFPSPEPGLADPTEGEYLLGDENLAELKMAVHWSVEDGQALRFRYGLHDPERLVRSTVLAAVREVVGGEPIAELFTSDRQRTESEIQALAQSRLTAYESGIRITSFQLLHAHAPSEVHAAFRDVASALEDRDTKVNLARAEEARLVPLARGEAVTRQTEAESGKEIAVRRARGKAEGFTDLHRAYRKGPGVTRQRFTLETLEKVLPEMRTYIKPPESGGDGLEIWFVNSDSLSETLPVPVPAPR